MLVNISLLSRTPATHLCAECDQPGRIMVRAGVVVTPLILKSEVYGPGALTVCVEHAAMLAKEIGDLLAEVAAADAERSR